MPFVQQQNLSFIQLWWLDRTEDKLLPVGNAMGHLKQGDSVPGEMCFYACFSCFRHGVNNGFFSTDSAAQWYPLFSAKKWQPRVEIILDHHCISNQQQTVHHRAMPDQRHHLRYVRNSLEGTGLFKRIQTHLCAGSLINQADVDVAMISVDWNGSFSSINRATDTVSDRKWVK